jgi:hypothetical protein
VIGLFFAWFAYHRSQATDIGADEGILFFSESWPSCFLGIAVLAVFIRWIETGRIL